MKEFRIQNSKNSSAENTEAPSEGLQTQRWAFLFEAFFHDREKNHIFLEYEGEWKDGKEWNGTEYDNNGNILGKLVNGEWIKN